MSQMRQLLGFAKKSNLSVGECDDCATKAFNHFCTICSQRFCADHIDDESKHPCGTRGLTKKQYRQVAKERAWSLNSKEREAIEFGKKMAESRGGKVTKEDEARDTSSKLLGRSGGFR